LVALNAAVNDANEERRKRSTPALTQAIARGIASAFAFAIENGQQSMLKKNYISARDMFQAGEIIQPEKGLGQLSGCHRAGRIGPEKPVIEELKKAMEKGMTNAAALDDNAF
jgi:predicted nucleic acid-binding protein